MEFPSTSKKEVQHLVDRFGFRESHLSHLGLRDDTEGYSFVYDPEKKSALRLPKLHALHLGSSGSVDPVVLEMFLNFIWS